MAPRSLAVYVSSHGFGHATRISEVIAGFLDRVAECAVHVRTTAPAWLFPASGGRLRVHPIATDVGMVQPHGLTIDFAATIARLDEFEERWDARLAAEAAWLDEVDAGLVLGDVPPLASAAAARTGVASVVLANFSWDWIYGCYVERDPRFAVHAKRAAASYAGARRLYRLPFHAPMPVFRSTVDVPLIARRCRLSRAEARNRLGLPAAGRLVLLSFGGFGPPALEASRFEALSGVSFVATHPCGHAPNLIYVDRPRLDYAMLLRACDAVLTKPGWGILAASLVNAVRVLYTTREDFPETPILVDALRAHAIAEPIALEDLARGEIRGPLEAVLARPVAETELAANGAALVAELLAEDIAA
jgi:L-arabinokinase